MAQIQKRLREVIKGSGYSQKEIAKAIGVTPQAVSRYMLDDIFPALDTLTSLRKFLDVRSD